MDSDRPGAAFRIRNHLAGTQLLVVFMAAIIAASIVGLASRTIFNHDESQRLSQIYLKSIVLGDNSESFRSVLCPLSKGMADDQGVRFADSVRREADGKGIKADRHAGFNRGSNSWIVISWRSLDGGRVSSAVPVRNGLACPTADTGWVGVVAGG